jgi:ATP adenylyltransferase/5',5'''-P-1,P-4-tetraphosphate phosphorylase II
MDFGQAARTVAQVSLINMFSLFR